MPEDVAVKGAVPASIAANDAFRGLLRSRTRFVLWASLILLVFNLLQPVLSVFTTWLDQPAVGALSVGWVYAFAQFIVPLILLHLYVYQTRSYDAGSAAIREKLLGGTR